MAKGSKSRIVIWTIIGILVVVAIIFLVTNKKGGGTGGTLPLKPEKVAAFVRRTTVRLDKLEAQLAEKQAAHGPEAAETFDSVSVMIERVKTGFIDVQDMTDVEALTNKKKEILKDLSKAKHLLKSIE
ncbi:hypothetical protein CH330_00685 [candidate division WOR-3 bacterium JGI_Cruoil_03_51_56]|uniref:Uncharacterized protein n=1 Tax=candidate division WOR-3 bacterium JGI_Cruoil_03_51_56 TaxID=1973747 RepID=A0A235BYH9_UNCW3|nr:MAG: hypothetical protein CH330_00685 [candidate division WOR-3 bacterium JGI_Cruoil_03_51_56]